MNRLSMPSCNLRAHTAWVMVSNQTFRWDRSKIRCSLKKSGALSKMLGIAKVRVSLKVDRLLISRVFSLHQLSLPIFMMMHDLLLRNILALFCRYSSIVTSMMQSVGQTILASDLAHQY